MTTENTTGLEIAVIGMAGQFPGAIDIHQFWRNLKESVESFTFFSDRELIDAGIDPGKIKDPNYIKSCGGVLEDKEYFDAAFFGYKPTEAEVMDPQTRVFLQCAWHALEDAAYDPGSYKGLIGLYAGSSSNFRWEALTFASGAINALGQFTSSLFTQRDFLCTHVSYNLGLKGPGVYLKTTCSTSLVAVHLACQAILNGECDMALAGGVSIITWEKSGYLYQEGMIISPDGHCRAFDAEAKGTVGGEGVGTVVLKRLEEALEDRDHIYAVVKGTAVNNDGTRKIGYTAPSIDGQAGVIREAHRVADVEPGSITYVETHGTGTPVGDPIEIEALKTAFKTNKKGFCRIGSVKTNIGHLDSAAGIAGFIKTVLALKHRQVPPSLHFNTPNPKIDFDNSPFRVNATLSKWESDGYPLRAGVSSFGIGGTNAHTVLEEWPDSAERIAHSAERKEQLILLSAKTPSALNKMTENLRDYFSNNPVHPVNPQNPVLPDIAYTLQVGRRAFKHRRMLVCSTVEEAVEALSVPGSRKVRTGVTKAEDRPVVFMFSGLGAQYVNMGRDLYEAVPAFREEMDRCFEILEPLVDDDIKEILYPGSFNRSYKININQTEITQLVIFAIEYALAKMLIKWGIKPYTMIGYSFGEYTAACIAGVLSLEDALHLVVQRSRLIRTTRPGAMLSVPLPKEEVNCPPSLSLAIDNGPSCIVSGPEAEAAAFEERMKEKKYLCVRLTASHALHSHMMEPILKEFRETVSRLELHEPRIPYISNVTGDWIKDREAVDPGYWVTHLRETVRFADGVKQLLNHQNAPNWVFLEIGPGYDLCTLLRHHIPPEGPSPPVILNLVDQARCRASENHDDARYLLDRLGRLWLAGGTVDWAQLYTNEKKYRVPLPLYPFEKKRYWLEGDPLKMTAGGPPEKREIRDWFYIPSWKRSVVPAAKEKEGKSTWLLFADETGLGEGLAKRLEQEGHDVIEVRRGASFTKIKEKEYTVNPRDHLDYNTLFNQLEQMGKTPGSIVHCWSVTKDIEEKFEVEEIQDQGFYSLIYLARAAGKQSFKDYMEMFVISNHLHRVTSEEKLCPAKAAVLGAVKVIPKEYFNIGCRSIDIVLPEPGSPGEERLAVQLLSEFSISSPDDVVAYRGDYRWVQVFEPLPMEMGEGIPRLKEKGVYLITGGLGGIGLVLAKHLAEQVHARLILTGRSALPAEKLKKVQDLEEIGAEVLVCSADAADPEQMRTVIAEAGERFGPINGVIHAAGLPDGGVIPLRTRDTIEPVLVPKVQGTLVLDRVLKEKQVKLDFFILCSSISAVIGLFGQVAYCAANAFLDAFAYQKTHEEGVFTVSIDWDFWKEVGMGVDTVRQLKENRNISDADALLKYGILPDEGMKVFDRILAGAYPQVIVSTWDFFSRVQVGGVFDDADTGAAAPREMHPRPELTTEYEPPETNFEKTFADILQQSFGFQQVGIHDNFFEFGITSLDMIHINNVLKKTIEKDIPIVVMFEYPTIFSLEQYLGQSEAGAQPEDLDEVEDLLHQSIDAFRTLDSGE
jgi:acyl transferase domain-containing protein